MAEQHFNTLVNMFSNWKNGEIDICEQDFALLIGDTPEKKKAEIRNKLESGEIKVVVGTHALLESPINFKWLQMAIIDEQHRFGVAQRAALCAKNSDKIPHLLSMTATPIPRTLALTIWGDLDVSTIKEMPQGRKKIITKVITRKRKNRNI